MARNRSGMRVHHRLPACRNQGAGGGDGILRISCNVCHGPRDFDLHGKTIKTGDNVLYWYASANRDETDFDQPFRVDLARTPNKHLAFGQGGPHLCLGMWLARLEVRVLFQELAKRIKSVEPAGEQKFLRSNFVAGLKNLPVRVTLQ